MAATLHRLDPMATKLPLDVIGIEILPRLPAKSLLQLKCVCKFFKTLISSSEFINLHLHRHSLSSDSYRLLILVGENCHGIFSLNLDSQESGAVNIPLPRGLESLNPSIFILGSCNGLLFIQISTPNGFRLSLLNPSTRMYKQILFFRHKIGVGPSTFGFGFDSETDDYKVMIMINYFDQSVRPRYTTDLIIYSLKANTWKLVERTTHTTIPAESLNGRNPGALINNHLLHWMDQNIVPNIRCFDLRTEQWGNDVQIAGSLSIPDEKNEQPYFVDIGVFDGCLCLSTHSTVIDVWIMKEYGVKDSWVKLLSVSYRTAFPLVLPVAYRQCSRRSEILVRQGYRNLNTLLSYNVRDQTSKMAEIQGLPPFSEAYSFSESLVAIAGGRTIFEWEQMGSNHDEEDDLLGKPLSVNDEQSIGNQ